MIGLPDNRWMNIHLRISSYLQISIAQRFALRKSDTYKSRENIYLVSQWIKPPHWLIEAKVEAESTRAYAARKKEEKVDFLPTQNS